MKLMDLQEKIVTVFSNQRGEELLDMLMEMYVYTSSFDDNSHKMAFREGQRDLVLTIRGVLEHERRERSK